MVLDTWDGQSNVYEDYKDEGFDVQVNLIWTAQNGDRMPPNLTTYRNRVRQVLEDYPDIFWICVENEEGNPGYFDDFDPVKYLEMIDIVKEEATPYGTIVTNGGIIAPPLDGLTYLWLKDTYGNAVAQNFIDTSVPSYIRFALMNGTNPTYQASLVLFQQLVAGYAVNNMDYVNFHSYEPRQISGYAAESVASTTPISLQYRVEYLRAVVNKNVVCNETGQKNQNGQLTVDIMNKYNDNQIPLVLWWNGEGEAVNAVALNDAAGNLRNSGIAFRDYSD